MIMISRSVSIPDEEISLTGVRAQGAGGQHVNKASTAIHLRFDIKASSLPEFYKERLLAASHHLISADGVVIIKAQEYRSQEMNREAAIAAGCVNKRINRSAKKPPGDATDSGVKRATTCLQGAKVLSQSAAWESSPLSGMADGWNGL